MVRAIEMSCNSVKVEESVGLIDKIDKVRESRDAPACSLERLERKTAGAGAWVSESIKPLLENSRTPMMN